jgi:hypothetical protein
VGAGAASATSTAVVGAATGLTSDSGMTLSAGILPNLIAAYSARQARQPSRRR